MATAHKVKRAIENGTTSHWVSDNTRVVRRWDDVLGWEHLYQYEDGSVLCEGRGAGLRAYTAKQARGVDCEGFGKARVLHEIPVEFNVNVQEDEPLGQ